MKKIEFKKMETLSGGADPNNVVGVLCAAAGVVTFFGGLFSGGLGWILGSAVSTGFCSGYGLAAATI